MWTSHGFLHRNFRVQARASLSPLPPKRMMVHGSREHRFFRPRVAQPLGGGETGSSSGPSGPDLRRVQPAAPRCVGNTGTGTSRPVDPSATPAFPFGEAAAARIPDGARSAAPDRRGRCESAPAARPSESGLPMGGPPGWLDPPARRARSRKGSKREASVRPPRSLTPLFHLARPPCAPTRRSPRQERAGAPPPRHAASR